MPLFFASLPGTVNALRRILFVGSNLLEFQTNCNFPLAHSDPVEGGSS